MTINTLATTSLATKSPGADGPCHQPTLPQNLPPAIMGQKKCRVHFTTHTAQINFKSKAIFKGMKMANLLQHTNGKLNFFHLYPISEMGNFFTPQMGFEVFFKLKNIAICYFNGNCAGAKVLPKFRADNLRIITENFGIAFILGFWRNYGG